MKNIRTKIYQSYLFIVLLNPGISLISSYFIMAIMQLFFQQFLLAKQSEKRKHSDWPQFYHIFSVFGLGLALIVPARVSYKVYLFLMKKYQLFEED